MNGSSRSRYVSNNASIFLRTAAGFRASSGSRAAHTQPVPGEFAWPALRGILFSFLLFRLEPRCNVSVLKSPGEAHDAPPITRTEAAWRGHSRREEREGRAIVERPNSR